MSEDTYAEAEQIVREVGSGRRNAMPYHDNEDKYVERYRALVAALAAAIELDELSDETYWGVMHGAFDRLGHALSVLRARAGEET